MPLSHRRSRSQGLKAHERRTGFLLLVPALIAFTAVILWPFLQSLRLSLYKFTIEMEQPKFVGLQNFARILNDPGTLTVWLNTLVFVVVTTCISAFKVFDTVLALTQGKSQSEVILYAIYLEGFQYFKMGYAAALTLIFLGLIFVASSIQLIKLDKKAHYA